MKPLCFLVLAVLISLELPAQVKIGDNPENINTDAILELESANTGLLLPRIALTSTTLAAPLASHTAGMLVYNTATAGDVFPGTYFNNGTGWVRLPGSEIEMPATPELSMEITDCGVIVLTDTTTFNQPVDIYNQKVNHILRNLKQTAYGHSVDSIADECTGTYIYDCSGFAMEFTLHRVLPNHYQSLINGLSGRPLVDDLYNYFMDTILGPSYNPGDPATCIDSNQYWIAFTDFSDIQSGDLIVAKYDPEWNDTTGNSTTGHVMIAWDTAYVDDPGEPQIYRIRVADAASSPHSRDTRLLDGDGIGEGDMYFKTSTNASNRPIQYKWSLSSTYFYKNFSYYLYDYDGNYSNDPSENYPRLEGIVLARPK